MLTTESVRIALNHSELNRRYTSRSLARLVYLANRELREWGHSGHQIAVERIAPYFGDSEILRWSLWCETCHVPHHALIDAPYRRATRDERNTPGSLEPGSRSRRRWILWPSTTGLMQRILG